MTSRGYSKLSGNELESSHGGPEEKESFINNDSRLQNDEKSKPKHRLTKVNSIIIGILILLVIAVSVTIGVVLKQKPGINIYIYIRILYFILTCLYPIYYIYIYK